MKNLKKLLTMVIVLAMVVTTTCVSGAVLVQADTTLDVWDGSTTAPTKGQGTDVNPYRIGTPEELAYVIANGGDGKNYKLTADIYLNDTTKIDWQDGTVEDGYTVNRWYTSSNSTEFYGVLDGDGYTVYGMYVTDETTDARVGLIPRASNTTTIKNLGVDCAFVEAANGSASAFVGKGESATTFDTCYVGVNVTVNGQFAGLFFGNGGANVTISKCYSLGTVTGTSYYGVSGDCWGGTRIIVNSFFVDAPITTKPNDFTCTNVYTTDGNGGSGAEQLTSDNMQGLDALTNASKMSALLECGAFTATEAYPILTVFVKGIDDEIELDVWDGTEFAPINGSGAENDPHQISTPEQLAYVIKKGGGGFYKLTADIYLNDISKIDWQDGTVADGYTVNQWYNKNNITSPFYGVIDGNGYTVYGLYTTDETSEIGLGLLPYIQEGGASPTTIKNLGIDCAYVNAPNGFAGAFVGETRWGNTTTFDTCYVGANVTVNGNTAGLFYGRGGSDVTISNSYSLGTVKGTSKYGIVGDCWGSIRTLTNSYVSGSVITTSHGLTCTNVYTTDTNGGNNAVRLTTDNMKGLDALTNTSKMSGLADCEAFTATEEYPILSIFNKELDIWDGTKSAPVKGTGVENDPYLISTPEEFAYIINHYYNASKYFKLTTDIYLNDTTKINWQDGTVADGYTVKQWCSNYSNAFRGVLDGDGHIVYGMYISDETTDVKVGLIPLTQEGGDNATTIKSLGVDCAYVNAPNGFAGAFVGATKYNNTTTFDTCYVGANVTVNGKEAGSFYGRGGTDVAISKSYSLGTVTGTDYYGVVGNCWGGTREIDNSFFVNVPITSKTDASMTCTNVYATNAVGGINAVQLTSDNMKGLGALKASTKMVKLADCEAFIATAGYPVLSTFPYSATKYIIFFNPNGGTVSTDSIKAVAGAVIEFPVAEKDGYIFKAWCVDEELTTQATNIMPSENLTYYAKWYKLYDVDNDGEVCSLDLTQLRKLLLGSLESDEISIDGADCNQDSQVNIIDLVRLKKVLAGVQVSSTIPEGYRLVWSDEFDGNELSTDKWSYANSSTSSDMIINRENITVSNGSAKLFINYDAENEVPVLPTSIKTSNSLNIKYGYIEMKAKMPNYAMGEWPALWMTTSGANISKDELNYVQYDYDIEIDIMEKMSTVDSFQSQLHMWSTKDSVESVTNILNTSNVKTFENSEVANDWHLYALKWTEDTLEFYLDGVIYCTYNIPEENKANFGVYMDLILSMQYQVPSSDEENYFAENADFELSFEIDYVRVYQNALTDSFLLK